MGTSSSYGGRKDSSPLLPPDYNGDDTAPDKDETSPDIPQQPIPHKDKPWQNVKTATSYYITGHSSRGEGSVNHIIRSYGRASGGAVGMMRSSSAGLRAGHSLSQFLSSNYSSKDSVYERINNILQSEHDVKTALSKIADIISPVPEGKEDAVARDAIINTLCQLYDYLDANNLDITDLNNLDTSIQEQLFTTYVSEYIWGRMLNDLQICFEKNAETPERATEVEKDFKDYIYAKVSVEVHKGSGSAQANVSFDVDKIFHDCYEVLM
jgi:hypothetical protein